MSLTFSIFISVTPLHLISMSDSDMAVVRNLMALQQYMQAVRYCYIPYSEAYPPVSP